MLCDDYMEDYEAKVPFQALQAYGVAVHAVCPDKRAGDICHTVKYNRYGPQGMVYSAPNWLVSSAEIQGHDFSLNATFDEIDANNYDGLIIPGARAPEYLAMNGAVLDLVHKFSSSGKPIASICHGQLILAAADCIKGRKCTGFPTVKPVLIAAGAHWVEPTSREVCVVDGNLITAVVYSGHPEYIQSFLKALGGVITGPKKQILFLCGDFMEDYDVIVPLQSLQALGCDVDAVCPYREQGDICPTAVHDFELDHTRRRYSEKPGRDFILTASFGGIDASTYDGLVIPGGRTAEYLALDENVLALVKSFMKDEKPIASIGYGQQVLAAADVLKGKKCTAFPPVKLNVVLAGATWVEPESLSRCLTDGNLVTGAAWPGHPELISQFMSLLGVRVLF